ncbi:ACT domain-containing protein [Pseudoruegeria sp. SK021]|uniref:ACT domain-containing protein n=1 Tax=Pseudoruegeria sp. SK021 TaxID=1933035 RepID=UPI000A22ADD1|nr:ACT domain-containing protein [Pseudoruegeria sp. SK021]OSP55968.1 ribonuclease H family protein [Pseudoruegeria sp. SK021]
MTGETDLTKLLRTMSADLVGGLFVFATVADGIVPAGLDPVMTCREAEGTTVIVPKDTAEAQGMTWDFPCRMITLQVHSSLAAVGFLARITQALAQGGIGVNPVSGYFHDHLFVPDGRQDEALEILRDLAQSTGPA